MRLVLLLPLLLTACQTSGTEAALDGRALLAPGPLGAPTLAPLRAEPVVDAPTPGQLVFLLRGRPQAPAEVLAPFHLGLAAAAAPEQARPRDLMREALELEAQSSPGGADSDLELRDGQLVGGIAVARDRATFRASLLGGVQYVLIDAEREGHVEVAGEIELVGPFVGLRLQF